MSLTNRKNQINFLQVRPKENPAATQNSDNTADAFKRLNTVLLQFDSRDTQLARDIAAVTEEVVTFPAVSESVAAVTNIPVVQGSLLGPTVLSGTPVAVSHSLGRVPVGYFLADINAPDIVYRTAWDAGTITVANASTGSVTIKLWVF